VEVAAADPVMARLVEVEVAAAVVAVEVVAAAARAEFLVMADAATVPAAVAVAEVVAAAVIWMAAVWAAATERPLVMAMTVPRLEATAQTTAEAAEAAARRS
jgi:hypothetical protein